MDNISPCKDCGPDDRYESCHAVCDKFIAWKKQYSEEKQKIREQKRRYSMIEDDIRYRSDKCQKKKHVRGQR